MDGAWRANSYCTTFDTRAGRGRYDGANVKFPSVMRKRNCRMHCFHLECAIDWWPQLKIRVFRVFLQGSCVCKVRKKHCGRRVRVHHTDSARRNDCWTSILHLAYYIQGRYRVVYVSGRPMGDVRCSDIDVRYPEPRRFVRFCHVMTVSPFRDGTYNSHPRGLRTMAFRFSRCVLQFGTIDHGAP
ncbi:hypothetical protein BJV77DRAFT_732766 [Russula vinacea]|nr:hypothetical protein BJV77DRAFT_732766 [Russula vinacea]